MKRISHAVSAELIAKLNGFVTKAHAAREYRPQVVAIIRGTDDRYLFARSAKHPDVWGFIQGGILPGEDILAALYREVTEESGIPPSHLGTLMYRGSSSLEFVSFGTAVPDGFTRGKVYYFFLAPYLGDSHDRFTPQDAEVAELRWVTRDEMEALLAGSSPEKQRLLLEMIT